MAEILTNLLSNPDTLGTVGALIIALVLLVRNRNYWRDKAETRREVINGMKDDRLEEQQKEIDFLERIAEGMGSDEPRIEQD